jgi:hypothetical protein
MSGTRSLRETYVFSRIFLRASEGTTAIPSRNGSVAFSPVSGPKQPRRVFTVSATAIVMLSGRLTFLRSAYGH